MAHKAGRAASAPNKHARTAFWPWQNSLQYRILFAYGALFLVTLILLVIYIGRAFYHADLEAGEHELEVTAVLAANALEDPLSGYIAEFEKHEDEERAEQEGQDEQEEQEEQEDDGKEGNGQNQPTAPVAAAFGSAASQPLFPRLQQVADRYASKANTRVSIYATSGDALADSHFDPNTIPNQSEQPELRAALLNNVGSAIRSTADDATPTIFAAASIKQADRLLGFVQVSKPVSAVTADTRTMLLRLALAALAALAIATLLAVWIGQRLVQPLRRLEEAAFAVAEGDLSQTVPVTSNDEVGALARAFNYMVVQVRTTLDQQRTFVANASHELRTPLTNIKLRSEALRALGSEPALEERYLAEIESEADRLTRLADDLLDLTRLEEGAWQQAHEPIDVRPVLKEVTEIMQLRVAQAGLTLATEIDAPLPKLRVSVDDLETVTVNLLDNAVKYTPRGGIVQLRAAEGDTTVEIRVEDNGPGIPAEDVLHIFDRFYRVDKARSRRKRTGGDASSGSGAGLGLAIVRRLVELNGGEIRVEPAPERGTVFVVSFPAVA